MGTKRDDFLQPTIEIMRKRVGYYCSNPDCRKHTVGPNADPEKATLVGVAAHIAAASPDGPRFDVNMSQAERRHISNGLWLCTSCSMLIDKDPDSYPTALLQDWKRSAEQRMTDNLEGRVEKAQDSAGVPYLEGDLIWSGGMRQPLQISGKTYELYPDRIIPAGSIIIRYWRITWKLSFVLFNNSDFNAYNLKIIKTDDRLDFPALAKVNNLASLGNIDMEYPYMELIEGTHLEADELMSQRIPTSLYGASFEVSYQDRNRKEHVAVMIITEHGVISKLKT